MCVPIQILKKKKKNLEQRSLESHPELAKSCINGKALVSQTATSNENSVLSHAASSSYFCNKGKDTCCGKDFDVFPLQCLIPPSSLATWHMGICVEWYREQGLVFAYFIGVPCQHL